MAEKRISPKADSKSWFKPPKRILCIWWSVAGVIYWELFPEKTTVNSIRYCSQINKLETEVIIMVKYIFSMKTPNHKLRKSKIIKDFFDSKFK